MRAIDVTRMPFQGEPVSAWVTTGLGNHPLGTVLWNMHQAYEIEVVLRGQEARYSEGASRAMAAGDIGLAPGWEPHGFEPYTADLKVLVVFFVPAFLGDEMLGELPWFAPFAAPFADRPRPATPAARRELLAVAGELVREAGRQDQQSAAWRTAVRLGVLRLLLIVCQEWHPPAPSRGTEMCDLARIAPAMALVSAHPEQRLELAEAAAACALSVSRFGVVFRRSMGMSFARFALHSRLTHAAQLLLSSDAPTHVVAERTGFSDASHFHHAFAKCYGCTPAAYRRGGGTRVTGEPLARAAGPGEPA